MVDVPLKTKICFLLFIVSCNTHAPNLESHSLGGNPTTEKIEVFKAERDCQKHPLANYWHCLSEEVVIKPQAITVSNNSMIRSLGAKNKLEYTFKCSSSSPLVAKISILGSMTSAFEVSPTEVDENQSLNLLLRPSSDTLIIKVIDPSLNRTSITRGDCHFTVTSNITVPNTDPLEIYASFLIELREWANESLIAIDEASNLGEKWNVLVYLPQQLEKKANAEIRKCRRQVEGLRNAQQTPENPDSVREIAKLLGSGTKTPDLSRLCPAPFDANLPEQNPCLASIDLLTEDGDIGLIQHQIKESACLARDLREGMPSTEECFKEGIESHLCLKILQDKRSVLAEKKSTALEPRILSLADFLNAEILRLTDLSDSVTQELKELLRRLYD